MPRVFFGHPAVAAGDSFAYGISIETDSALGLSVQVGVGVSSETDTSVGRALSIGVSVSAETDASVSRAVSVAPGVSVETDVSVSRAVSVGVGVSVETDTALALSEAVVAPPAVGGSGGGTGRGVARHVPFRVEENRWTDAEWLARFNKAMTDPPVAVLPVKKKAAPPPAKPLRKKQKPVLHVVPEPDLEPEAEAVPPAPEPKGTPYWDTNYSEPEAAEEEEEDGPSEEELEEALQVAKRRRAAKKAKAAEAALETLKRRVALLTSQTKTLWDLVVMQKSEAEELRSTVSRLLLEKKKAGEDHRKELDGRDEELAALVIKMRTSRRKNTA